MTEVVVVNVFFLVVVTVVVVVDVVVVLVVFLVDGRFVVVVVAVGGVVDFAALFNNFSHTVVAATTDGDGVIPWSGFSVAVFGFVSPERRFSSVLMTLISGYFPCPHCCPVKSSRSKVHTRAPPSPFSIK